MRRLQPDGPSSFRRRMAPDPARNVSMPLVISVSGARGVVGDGLTPDLVTRLAAAHATFCGGGPIAIGRDSRISGPLVLAAAACGVRAVGADALDLGIVPTPTVQLAVEEIPARGGLAVS